MVDYSDRLEVDRQLIHSSIWFAVGATSGTRAKEATDGKRQDVISLDAAGQNQDGS